MGASENGVMDNKAFYNLTYGVFLLSTAFEGKKNACIINTCIQVANSPTRLLISCINANYTTELLKKSGAFTLSVLDNTCTFDFIKNFGLQSGRNADKFDSIEFKLNSNKIPYIETYASSLFSCHIVEKMDLGSHTAFVAEVDEAKVLSHNTALTYSDYQNKLKPKPANANPAGKIKGWRCKICGYVFDGEKLPADFLCPLCGHPASDFEPIYA